MKLFEVLVIVFEDLKSLFLLLNRDLEFKGSPKVSKEIDIMPASGTLLDVSDKKLSPSQLGIATKLHCNNRNVGR